MDEMNPGSEGLLRDAFRSEENHVDPSRMPWHVWGGLLWRFSDNAFVHPFAPHPRGPGNFVVRVKLRRNSDDAFAQPVGFAEADFLGDSELDMSVAGAIGEFCHTGAQGVSGIVGDLVPNASGRAGTIRMGLVGANRLLDVYRMAQTAFNKMAMDVCVRHGVPLRKAAMLLVRIEEGNEEFAVVAPIGYPTVPAVVSLNHPLPLARLYANFADGLGSMSPFYAFLCFFSLVEFMIGPLQGRLRRLHQRVPIQFENLAGSLSAVEVRHVGRFMSGTSYADLLENTRNQRNAVAHFLIEMGSRPLNVVAEDQIAFQRDALKIACRNLLGIVERNTARFLQAGVSERSLTTVFEGRAWGLSDLIRVLQARIHQVP